MAGVFQPDVFQANVFQIAADRAVPVITGICYLVVCEHRCYLVVATGPAILED